MNAIDREESSAVPEGTVLEVYRSGYEWNGEVFRPAQVKVSLRAGRTEKLSMSDLIVGIDLGTTNSEIAAFVGRTGARARTGRYAHAAVLRRVLAVRRAVW